LRLGFVYIARISRHVGRQWIRRRHERSDVEAPVNFSWKGSADVRQHQGEGTLQNISRGGVFIRTGDPPPLGTRVKFKLFFRSFVPDSRLVMQASARVVRAEPSSQAGARAGFAATLKIYILRNDKEIIELVKR
jgi:PilZ domain